MDKTYPSAAEVILCWNPETSEVCIVPWPDTHDRSRGYGMTGLGCNFALHKMKPEQLKMVCYIEAVHLIVRDRCDPMAVHKALLGVREYRAGLASDMPGVTE